MDSIDNIMRTKTSRTLKEYINREMGGDLARFLGYTQMLEDEFDAAILREAFSGVGCDKKVVVEVLTSRSFPRLQKAK
jgi:hypothetical protein